MDEINVPEINDECEYTELLEAARRKIGREMLNEADVFVLLCDKILHSYSMQEKGYA